VTPEEAAFAKAVAALRPYLMDLVIVGGWAHRLFRFRSGTVPQPFPPLLTDDADIATPLKVAPGRPRMDELLKQAGFKEDLFGDEKPPISTYTLETTDGVFELEFIANRDGGRLRRGGSRNVTEIVAGVTAQKVRHVDVLLLNPWSVTLDSTTGFEIPDGPAAVQVPNATSYLVQKLLVLAGGHRAREKRPKDVLYMFDTLRMFADALQELQQDWSLLVPKLSRVQLRDFDGLAANQFMADSPYVIEAAQIARDSGRSNPPDAATIAATCRAGFDEVFQ
jgi:hypothetical protein